MNNDLISREALKKAFENLASDDYNEPIWYQKTVFETIDNAPTVDTIPNEEGHEMYNKGYMSGYERGKNERPQGEWIDHSEDGYVECPFCEHLTTCEDNIDELHYCWNCGAKMKGGAE